MSVGGFTLVSVISPGVATCAPSGCGDAPLARGRRPGAQRKRLAERKAWWSWTGWSGSTGARARAGAGLDGRGLDGRGLDGRGQDGRGRDWAGAGGRGELAEVELSRVEFAVVDLETTGWSPGAAAITEIGAVRVRGGQRWGERPGEFVRQGEFASLVNPGMPVPPGIADLTGITDWMLAAAPRLGAVLPGPARFRPGLRAGRA